MTSLSNSKISKKYSLEGTFYAMCISPDGRRVFAGGSDYSLHCYDTESDKNLASWKSHDNYVSCATFIRGPRIPDSVVSGSYDRKLVWWDAHSGKPYREIEAHQGWIRDVVSFPDHERIVSVGDDMTARIWDAKTGKMLNQLIGHAKRTPQNHVTALYVASVSSDGNLIATADRIGDVRVWDANSGTLLHQVQVPVLYTYDPRQRKRSIGGIRALAFSADSSRLAVGGMGQVGNVDGMGGLARVELTDWESGKVVGGLQADGHKGQINHLEFHPNGKWLVGVGGGADNAVIAFWELDKEKPLHKIKQDGHYHRLAILPSGSQFYVAGYKNVEVWNIG